MYPYIKIDVRKGIGNDKGQYTAIVSVVDNGIVVQRFIEKAEKIEFPAVLKEIISQATDVAEELVASKASSALQR